MSDGIRRRLRTAGAKQSEWLDARDNLIREAHSAGASLREIAAEVGLTHVAVMKIVNKDHSRLDHTIAKIQDAKDQT